MLPYFYHAIEIKVSALIPSSFIIVTLYELHNVNELFASTKHFVAFLLALVTC